MTLADRAAWAIATLFGLGHMRPAPGSWGSLAAALIAPWLGPALIPATPMAAALGLWAAGRRGRRTGLADDPRIVVDELAGQWLALWPVLWMPGPVPDWARLAIGFALFRFFDIVKPGPVAWADRRVTGGLGVMLDDLIAGALAAITLASILFGLERI